MKNNRLAIVLESIKANYMPLLKMICVYVVLIIGTEAFFRKSLMDTVLWMINEPFLFAMNVFVLTALSSVLLMLTKRIEWVTLVVGGVATVLSFVNIGKFQLRNVPLLYEDFFLLNEVWVLMPEILNIRMMVMMAICVMISAILGHFLIKWFRKSKLQKHRGITLMLMTMSVLFLLIGQNINSADISIMDTGFIYSLSNNTRQQMIIHDEQLQEAKVLYKGYLEAYDALEEQAPLPAKPNVIIIQSEAFWDVNKLGVSFDQNPIPVFESLRKESIYGETYVPVFGGGTSNTEYEVLTGLTMKNFSNDWYMVYPNEIKSPTVSLASILRNQGYAAEGIHPYMSWYYNRVEVYRHFGFDSLKTIEYMNGYDSIGVFASDDYTTDLIIEALRSNEEPLFSFVVTMQNHGPYGNARFKQEDFDIQIKDKLTDSSRYLLANYTQGIHLSDKALGKLVEHLRKLDEPTILLFFGDHLPMLGEDYQIYREVGYVGKESTEELQKDMRIMAVPYIIWRNYDDTSVELPIMNLSYIPSILLREAGVEMPDYMKVSYMLREDMPLYLRGHGFDVSGGEITSDMPLFQNTQALFYKLYQTALDEDAWKVKRNNDFNKTLTEITIKASTVSGDETTVMGENFYESMKVYVKGNEMPFSFVSSNEIRLMGALSVGDEIGMKLFDSKGSLLAQSKKIYSVK